MIRRAIFVTGGGGVLGRPTIALTRQQGHEVVAPLRAELDLFDSKAVGDAVQGSDAVMHLATRIPPTDRRREPGAWVENDRLRTDATRILVDAALTADVRTFLVPTVTFVYTSSAQSDEDVAIDPDEVPQHLRSALIAEHEVARFAAAGKSGVVLRLGLLFGPGTGLNGSEPNVNAVLHAYDAARALLLALDAPSGIYNVVADGGAVSHDRFTRVTGWRPRGRALA